MGDTELVYKDIAKKLLTYNRFLKDENWVKEAEKARKNDDSSGTKENQYDKAEELITFYTFAPLERLSNEVRSNVIEEILDIIGISESVGKVKLDFEKILPPPSKYLAWLNKNIDKHPIRYIRKEATNRILKEEP